MLKDQNLYDKDFSAWCWEQAEKMKHKDFERIDFENIIEELESMGNSKESQLHNRFQELFLHLLKWIYQPTLRSNSWRNSIEDQRDRIEILLKKNPSLKSKLKMCSEEAYVYSRKMASRETGLSIKIFPEQLPFQVEKALDENWMPE